MNLKAEETDLNEAKERVEDLKLREVYELERDRIKQEFGGLDNIRINLGLSQRKICQLLLVDPSAWTRWLKSDAPPHIYQALRWLMEINRNNPHSPSLQVSLGDRLDLLQAKTHSRLSDFEQSLESLQTTLSPIYKEMAELNLKIALLATGLKRPPKRRKSTKKKTKRKIVKKKPKRKK
jgi:transcriptional regulator with XRE-family HTH domain